MPSQKRQPTRSNTKGHECVLLIASDADAAARVLGELGSVTEERFEVEWVTELSRGIERLCDGGVRAVVLDLNLPDSKGVGTFDKLFQAEPGVPILILSDAATEEEARQAVQHGAQDHLLKEHADGYRLRRTVRTMMDRWADRAVSRENALATITLDSIGEGVVRTDLCGNVTYLNGFAEKMSGWFREEALGRPVADVLRLVDSAQRRAPSQCRSNCHARR